MVREGGRDYLAAGFPELENVFLIELWYCATK